MHRRVVIPLKYLFVFLLGVVVGSILFGLLGYWFDMAHIQNAQEELLGDLMSDVEELSLARMGEDEELIQVKELRFDSDILLIHRALEKGTLKEPEAFEKILYAAKAYRSVYPSTTGSYTADKVQEVLDEIDLPPDFMEKDAPMALRRAVEEQRDEDPASRKATPRHSED